MSAEEALDAQAEELGELDRHVVRAARHHQDLGLGDAPAHLLRELARREEVVIAGDDQHGHLDRGEDALGVVRARDLEDAEERLQIEGRERGGELGEERLIERRPDEARALEPRRRLGLTDGPARDRGGERVRAAEQIEHGRHHLGRAGQRRERVQRAAVGAVDQHHVGEHAGRAPVRLERHLHPEAPAHEGRAGDALGGEHGLEIGRVTIDGVGGVDVGRGAARSVEPAVVPGDEAVAIAEVVDLPAKGRVAAAHAVEQHHPRRALFPHHVVGDLDPVQAPHAPGVDRRSSGLAEHDG